MKSLTRSSVTVKLASGLVVLTAISVAVVAGITLLRGDDTERLTAYETAAIDVIATQNSLVQHWNALVDDFTDELVIRESTRAEQFESAAISTRTLVGDSQSVILNWSRLEPPVEGQETHAAALEAMRATQQAFILFEDYFRSIDEQGVADDSLMESGERMMLRASQMWQLAIELALAVS